MADVGKVGGDSGKPQEAAKTRQPTEREKFRQMLKVEKVGEIDEDRKKKPRQRGEKEPAERELGVEKAPKPLPAVHKETPTPPARRAPSSATTSAADQFWEEYEETQGAQKKSAEPAPPQKVEEVAATVEELPIAPPPPEAGKPLPEEPKKKVAEVTPSAASAAVEALAPPPIAPPPEVFGTLLQGPAPTYASLSPEIFALFDHMVGIMTVMQASGITETSLLLNHPEYAASPFFGAEIVITEYSTAPLNYNIQLRGTPQAVALFQNNIEALASAFADGNYNFKVNRIEATLSSEGPRRDERAKVRRKARPGGDTAA